LFIKAELQLQKVGRKQGMEKEQVPSWEKSKYHPTRVEMAFVPRQPYQQKRQTRLTNVAGEKTRKSE
jgi:hypothetical protein